MSHKDKYYIKGITKLLEEAGFTTVQEMRSLSSLREAIKIIRGSSKLICETKPSAAFGGENA
jgi:hypothetical protein